MLENDDIYKLLLLDFFKLLLDIYDPKTAIVIMYQVIKLKGLKI